MTEKIECRLCGGIAQFSFEKKVLSKYQVSYYRCDGCGSLQTEVPYWLGEAYNPLNERFDTGQLIRSFNNAAFLSAIVLHLGLEGGKVIDYGCGSGLLVRLMRDVGFNVWGHDAYSMPRLAIGFHVASLEGATVINLSEVAEHFDKPAQYFDEIFSYQPEIVVAQTNLFEAQNSEWDYLAADHGQHIFFYSSNSIEYLARRHNIRATLLDGYIIFFKSIHLEKMFNPNSSTVRPELQASLNAAIPNLMNQMLINGYKYAIEDNLELRARESGG
ncbi:methyltransferase domain-containing protein [Polynucleobacter sp. 71A-WALBACH]|uniref:class I SAM-dependent methyltransferase n=1 Tax=Polynucleobacter sp. 71A-WALBACH TaxID=2689097 RepID=UPI001C0B9D80|nr:class I SAM-dependent methyltransferase [Polynucleobacter sp. 71A-WALBACH]MBU3593078.1 methyltransferase domain-containing protein [Polynucleobacter sp. 71A-WALBACH]